MVTIPVIQTLTKQFKIMFQSKSNFSNNLLLTDDDIGDDHIMTSLETPLRPDAFVLSDEEKNG